jgi:hypothetical protein
MKGHIRERSPPGHWAVIIDVRDPTTGKRRRRRHSVEGGKRAAQAECARLVAAVKSGAYVEPSRLTLGAWLTQWLATVKQEVSPKTHERYGELADGYLIPALGPTLLSKLSPVSIQAGVQRRGPGRPARRQTRRPGATNATPSWRPAQGGAQSRCRGSSACPQSARARKTQTDGQNRIRPNDRADPGAIDGAARGPQAHPRQLAGATRSGHRNAPG